MIPLINRVVPFDSGPHPSIHLSLHVFPVKLLQKRNPFVNNSFPPLFVWSGTLFQYLRAKTSATIFTFTNTAFAKLTKTKLCITSNLVLGHKNIYCNCTCIFMTKLFARICVCICICTALQEITLCVTRPRPAITHRHLVPPHYIHIIARNHASPCSYHCTQLCLSLQASAFLELYCCAGFGYSCGDRTAHS